MILGANGTGKSSLLDVMHAIFRLVTGWASVDDVFPLDSKARFSRKPDRPQSVTINFQSKGRDCLYAVEVAHTKRGKAILSKEAIWSDSQLLYKYNGKTVALHSKGEAQVYPFTAHHSPLSTLPVDEGTPLAHILNEFRKIWVVRPVPQLMKSVTQSEVPWLLPDMSNFADWFRDLAQSDPRQLERIRKSVRPILDGFEGFSFEATGSIRHRTRALLVKFRRKQRFDGNGAPDGLTLEELSDGQRMLLALYTLLHHVVAGGCTLCIDEPENYLALPEIQPWLDELRDASLKRSSQVFLVSHHPQIVDLLAESYGVWFERQKSGVIRTFRIADVRTRSDEALPLSTLVERGWIRG